MSRATSWRLEDVLKAKRDGARSPGCETTYKVSRICACELTLEEPVEFGVPRSFLAIWHAERVGLQEEFKMR
jgi:hypothetical protein